MNIRIRITALGIVLISVASVRADDAPAIAVATQPKVPDGFSIELVAGPPLVERPIVAAFDDEGRLYVAESSGSNDKVQKQLEEKPHRIVRLEDTDGDGKFDRRTVFADKMMFPEGAMWFDGSLYVAAPPSIWKLTDTDGDGVADERVEWFQGKTLTGCANDLHGPYAGPDGWIYWCKGAFAEQTHMVNGNEWTTKAAHIFRCRPDGTGLESVITAGMDNPVDVAFMPDGEMILSGTYFNDNPRHDGLAHAVYGGVYGKNNKTVLPGHARTGELMPLLVTMSAAACCGLERYDSDVFGSEYRDNLFLCQFNLRKVSRHVLKPAGSTYTSADSNFVTWDNVDFHPTDVVVDADGSLLVVDTGGWYKICCPTSQLYKPDVLGGIYRVRRIDSKSPVDPRGKKIDWPHQTLEQLWDLLADARPAVRQRATRSFVQRDSRALQRFLHSVTAKGHAAWSKDSHAAADPNIKLARVWALSQVELDDARILMEQFAADGDEEIRHVALHSLSLIRDSNGAVFSDRLNDTPANRRIAAEAVGRNGAWPEVPMLLAAAANADDRVLQHSIIYALIELAEPAVTRAGLKERSPKTVAAALIALDQMPGGELTANDVIPHLGASDETLRQAARWVVSQHAEWGGELAGWLKQQLATAVESAADSEESMTEGQVPLQSMLIKFAADAAVGQLLADTIATNDSSPAARKLALRTIVDAKLKEPPPAWRKAIAQAIGISDANLLPIALTAARALPRKNAANDELNRALVAIADSADVPTDQRIAALSIAAGSLAGYSDARFEMLVSALGGENTVAVRSAAADAFGRAPLNDEQLARLCGVIKTAGPLEINRLLTAFAKSTDEQIGLKLIESLKEAMALQSLRMDLVREALAKYSPAVQERVAEMESLVNVDAAAQRKRIEELLPEVAKGDVRRGDAVFHSSKAACTSCHRMGYAGGTVGPDLSQIGKIRTERDLLESILYPSLSFVRSYEPVMITTTDGHTLNGLIREETPQEYVVATGPDQETRIARGDVEQIEPSKVSVMPAGLDQQLTSQELADLVAFLKHTGGT